MSVPTRILTAIACPSAVTSISSEVPHEPRSTNETVTVALSGPSLAGAERRHTVCRPAEVSPGASDRTTGSRS
jgi:hypothetical protein